MVPYAYEHKPVMPEECIRHLDIKEDGTYIDATLGGGGHSSAILQRLGRGGKLVCIDRDEASVKIAGKMLLSMGAGAGLEIIRGNFADIAALCGEKGVTGADGILFDLGVSSWQIDDPERGFSYISDAVLDMRMDRSAELDAYGVVNTYDENRLRDILREYGEEKWASRIASFIVAERLKKPLTTTGELAGLVRAAIPSGARKEGGNPAKRTFQAIRIEVNNELEA
ncbi:MAG: 16S rRNA (cytosine(1402)-N(4))-methyltransferase RsmH, partial [Eubacteriales bacterium]|nr:16S rRNA (cytosine(1402)-N(4))-methyltransferase RsmH [Eubacteriales bacterium]